MKKHLLIGAGIVLVSLFSFQSLQSTPDMQIQGNQMEIEEEIAPIDGQKTNDSEDFMQLTD